MTTATLERPIEAPPAPVIAAPMRVQVLQENLKRALALVKPALARRNTLPITECVKLETVGGWLHVTATNLDIAITARVGAKIDAEGAVTIPHKDVSGFVSTLPKVTVAIDGKNFEANRGTVAFANTYQPDDYPRIKDVTPDVAELLVYREDFLRAAAYVEASAAGDDSRPVLTAVLFEVTPEGCTMVAADGFRLAKATVSMPEAPKAGTFLVPVTAIRVAAKLLKSEKRAASVRIKAGHTQATLEVGDDVTITTQLIQGTFPNYDQLIPRDADAVCTATFDTAAFASALKPVIAAARDGSGIVRLNMRIGIDGEGIVRLSAKADECAETAMEIDAEVSIGDGSGAGKIAFNARYLLDLVAAAGPTLTLRTTSPSAQGTFTSDGKGVTVIMPMFVQW